MVGIREDDDDKDDVHDETESGWTTLHIGSDVMDGWRCGAMDK